MKKRLLSLIIILTMMISFVPVISNADMSINIGQYLQMGTYYGEPILWRCVDIDENGPLMLSDKILCIKAFDAEYSENNTTGSHSRVSYRKSYESNYWGDSNIRSWLNSTAPAGNVEWLCGNPPIAEQLSGGYNAYADEAGFLTNFTQGELNAVKSVKQKSLLSYPEIDAGMATTGAEYHNYYYDIEDVVCNYDTAYAEYVTDKMFLLDVNQVNAVHNNGSILGEAYYIGEPTAQCVANSEYKKEGYLEAGEKWGYWLRSPSSSSNRHVRFVYSNGGVDGDFGDARRGDLGVRPAFYIVDDIIFEIGDGTEEDPYVIKEQVGIESKVLNYEKKEDRCIINSVITNRTENNVLCDMYSAVYSSSGVLKVCGMDRLAFLANNDTEVDIAVLCAIESGDVIKTFIWSDTMEALAKVSEFKVE